MTAQRRSSQRLQNIPQEKRPYYGTRDRKRTHVHKDSANSKKPKLNKCGEKLKMENERDNAKDDHEWLLPKTRISFTARVKETLRLFNLHYLQYVQVNPRLFIRNQRLYPSTMFVFLIFLKGKNKK